MSNVGKRYQGHGLGDIESGRDLPWDYIAGTFCCLQYGIVEVTTHCQCACPGCYMVRRGALNKGEMSLERAVKILDLCKKAISSPHRGEHELETMDILGGEPLQWAPLKEYIEILLRRNIKPWIFTNMLAITPKLAKWLFERKIYITGKLNINPLDKDQLVLQARMLGKDERMAAKLLESIQVFRDAGYGAPLFRLQNLIRKQNISFVPDYYRWCLANNIGTDLELMGSGEAINETYWKVAPEPEEIAQMITKIQVVRKEFGLKPAEVLMPHVFGSCPFYDKGLYFAVNGNIRACSNSTIVLGHIDDEGGSSEPVYKRNPVGAAWSSPLLCCRRVLRQENVGAPCSLCKKWDKCRGGCRATAEGDDGPFAGYPLCPLPYLERVE